MRSAVADSHRMPLVAIGFSVVLAAVLLYLTIGSLAIGAHEDNGNGAIEHHHHHGWVFACEDRISGCSEGGLLYHTELGPDASVYFIAHYSESGNVYARKVRFTE